MNTQDTTPAFMSDWHKALLWFLGAVALIAVAGPAPRIAIMILLIIMSLIILKYWASDYAKFLGIATNA
jgi:hypothetical protein